MLTPAQFDEVRQKSVSYSYRHQHEGRGPGCRECLHVDHGHAGKDQPVCLTVEELLAEFKTLVDETPAMGCEQGKLDGHGIAQCSTHGRSLLSCANAANLQFEEARKLIEQVSFSPEFKKFYYLGVEQDPLGVHAFTAKYAQKPVDEACPGCNYRRAIGHTCTKCGLLGEKRKCADFAHLGPSVSAQDDKGEWTLTKCSACGAIV